MTPKDRLILAFKQAMAEGLGTQEIWELAEEFFDNCVDGDCYEEIVAPKSEED